MDYNKYRVVVFEKGKGEFTLHPADGIDHAKEIYKEEVEERADYFWGYIDVLKEGRKIWEKQ